jgi:hypothetical protein
MRPHLLTSPLALALVVTLANAAKPVLVDDTAYVLFARHIAQHPLDPYGFDIFWYTVPEPAMEVLCPPVVPYWLAVGIKLFGDHPAVLKLWLFPFVWLLAWSVRELLRRFARGTEAAALPMIVLSPAVLPTVNLMLDVPAVALGLAALVLLIRGIEMNVGPRRLDPTYIGTAGLLAALAMQTKYTALLVPPVMLWYGWTHRALRPAVVAAAVAVVASVGWEALLVAKYDRSHFLYHLGSQRPEGEGVDRLRAFLRDKAALIAPLAAYLGCLAVGVGMYAGRAIGVPRRALLAAAGLWAVGVALIALLPHRDTILIPGKAPGHAKLTLAALVWRTAGVAVLLTAAAGALMLLVRCGRGIATGRRNDVLFLVGWVLLEVAGYFALTPFPAARRVIVLTMAIGILLARVVSRASRARPDRRPPRWVVPFGLAAGVVVAAIDTLDAYPEKVLAGRAAQAVAAHGATGRVWYVGHWGFQFYCEQAGMRPAIPGQSRLEPGDYLVLPLYPDDTGFWRPHPGSIPIRPPADAVELLDVFEWDDWLSAQTIPNFYGGTEPILGRDHPRLRVAVYRLVRGWAVQG